jgi:hypothetical protein
MKQSRTNFKKQPQHKNNNINIINIIKAGRQAGRREGKKEREETEKQRERERERGTFFLSLSSYGRNIACTYSI